MFSLLPLDLQVLNDRRQRLSKAFPRPVVLWAGSAPARNFAANTYPFRASSHFLYFAGLPLEGAAIRLYQGELELYWDEPPPKAALWQTLPPSRETIAAHIGATAHYPLAELAHRATDAATIPLLNPSTAQQQAHCLGRAIDLTHFPDRDLAEAIVHRHRDLRRVRLERRDHRRLVGMGRSTGKEVVVRQRTRATGDEGEQAERGEREDPVARGGLVLDERKGVAHARQRHEPLTGLKALIDAIPSGTTPGIAAVLGVDNDANGHNLDGLNHCHATEMATDYLVPYHGAAIDCVGSQFTNITVAYLPANPGHWAGTPPASVAEAIDRLAAAVSNNGATPAAISRSVFSTVRNSPTNFTRSASRFARC